MKAAGGSRNSITAHDDRAVMQRRSRIENRDHQVVTQVSIQLDTGIDDSFQTDIAFNNYQRAGLRRSQRRSGQNDFIIDAFAELAAMTARERHTKAIAKLN